MINQVKTPAEVAAMRAGGKILVQVLQTVAARVKPGATTLELAGVAENKLKQLGGEPVFLGYGRPPFPAVICISVNDEVVHGIPGSRRLDAGDVVGLDFGVKYQGLITDGAISVPVGPITADAERLMRATKQALAAGIAQVKAGARVSDISQAIEERLRQDKLGIIEDLIGHGVGHQLHEEPGIPNYGPPGRGMKLKAGMTLAIEPMACLGKPTIVLDADHWTVRTRDGSLAAHFEHTVLVTETGFEILTQS